MSDILRSIAERTWNIVNSNNIPNQSLVYAGTIVDQECYSQRRNPYKALVLASLACRTDSVTREPFFGIDLKHQKLIQINSDYPLVPHPLIFRNNLGMVASVIDKPGEFNNQYNRRMLRERHGITFDRFSPDEFKALHERTTTLFETPNDPHVSLFTTVLEAAAVSYTPLTAREVAQVSETVLKEELHLERELWILLLCF